MSHEVREATMWKSWFNVLSYPPEQRRAEVLVCRKILLDKHNQRCRN